MQAPQNPVELSVPRNRLFRRRVHENVLVCGRGSMLVQRDAIELDFPTPGPRGCTCRNSKGERRCPRRCLTYFQAWDCIWILRTGRVSCGFSVFLSFFPLPFPPSFLSLSLFSSRSSFYFFLKARMLLCYSNPEIVYFHYDKRIYSLKMYSRSVFFQLAGSFENIHI